MQLKISGLVAGAEWISFSDSDTCAMTYPSDRQLFVTYKDQVLSNCGKTMPQCDHEEAETRILYHVKNVWRHVLNSNFEQWYRCYYYYIGCLSWTQVCLNFWWFGDWIWDGEKPPKNKYKKSSWFIGSNAFWSISFFPCIYW